MNKQRLIDEVLCSVVTEQCYYHDCSNCIGLMQKYPPIFKKMFLNDVVLLWMRGFHAYDTTSVS